MFFRFAPMGKVEKTRFEHNYTTFVNLALCADWKSPPKMVLWNRNCKIRFPGCFFVSPRWGKSQKRVLNKIIRPSSTRLYALLGKAHPKWWCETEIVKFDSQGVFRFAPMGKVAKTRFEQNYTTFVNPALCAAWKSPPKMVVWNRNCKIRFPGCFFVSPRWGKSKKRVLNIIIRPSSTWLYALLGKAHPKWCYETEIVKFDSQGVFSFRPDGKSRKNAFWTKLYDLRQTGFMRCLEKPTQNGGVKPKLQNSIPRVFFRFAPMGKVEKTRFEHNYTTFVNPALCAAWKSLPKMVLWNRNCKIRFPGCFFVSPRWGKSKKRVLNKIIRPSSTRLYALLGKAHPKWWCETEIVKFDSQGVFSFRPDGESRKNAFWTRLYDLRQPGFMRCLEKPTQNGGVKPKLQNSIPRVFFRFAPMGKVAKTRFEQNYTTLVNRALCAAWKSPPKMVVWNRNCKIRFPGCFFVSPRWGKSKKCVLNIIIRPSSTRLYALLGKAHPKWCYETEIVKFDSQGVFSFRPDGESRKNAFWTKLYDLRQPGLMRCLEKPTQNGAMKPKL